MLSLGEIARSDAKHLDQKSTTRWHHLTNENAKYFGIENVEKKDALFECRNHLSWCDRRRSL